MQSLESISDEWFDAICWNFLLLGIFIIKQCVVFSHIVLRTLKYENNENNENKQDTEFSSS